MENQPVDETIYFITFEAYCGRKLHRYDYENGYLNSGLMFMRRCFDTNLKYVYLLLIWKTYPYWL